MSHLKRAVSGPWGKWIQQQNKHVKGFSGGSEDLRAKGHAGPSFFPQLDVNVKKDCFTYGIGSEDVREQQLRNNQEQSVD